MNSSLFLPLYGYSLNIIKYIKIPKFQIILLFDIKLLIKISGATVNGISLKIKFNLSSNFIKSKFENFIKILSI